MHKIELTFEVMSPMAISDGANDFLVDSDVLMDESGIPFVNQRRIKGLLREAVNETLEIINYPNKEDVIIHLFGNKGDALSRGSLSISKAKIAGEDGIRKTIQKELIPKSYLKRYFGRVISQTAINKKTGTALKHSLRKTRAVNEGFKFRIPIASEYLQDLDLIKLAVLQLDFVGSSRNRGLGNIKFNFNDEVDRLIEKIKAYKVPSLDILASGRDIRIPNEYAKKTAYLKLKLIDKIIITETKGEENTINTKCYIEGRKLWGVFAQYYLNHWGNDDEFKLIFRDGKIKFNSALPSLNNQNKIDILYPMPSNIHFKDGSKKVYNLFNEDPNDKTKSRKKYYTKDVMYEPQKSLTFHFSRMNERVSGSNGEGELFYYEALKEDNEFITKIDGNETLINKLLSAIFNGSKATEIKLGRSKNIEYGNAQIEVIENEINDGDYHNSNKEMVKEFSFYLTSPGIVLNQFLYPEPNNENLKLFLIDKQLPIQSISSVASFTMEQHYSAVWRSKTSLLHCFEKGTAFKVVLQSEVPSEQVKKIINNGVGIDTHLGFGACKLLEDFPQKMEDKGYIEYNDNEPTLIDDKLSSEYKKYKEVQNTKEDSLKQVINDNKINQITNSQLKRVSYYLEDYSNFNSLKEYVERELKRRPLYEVFTEKINYEDIHDRICGKDYEKFKIFMKEYLEMRRVLNNKMKLDGNN